MYQEILFICLRVQLYFGPSAARGATTLQRHKYILFPKRGNFFIHTVKQIHSQRLTGEINSAASQY